MIKASDAVREIVDNDPSLKTGLAQQLMNLSQVARHIHATVEARTHKNVHLSAITMALSRLRADLPQIELKPDLGLADRTHHRHSHDGSLLAPVFRAHRSFSELDARRELSDLELRAALVAIE